MPEPGPRRQLRFVAFSERVQKRPLDSATPMRELLRDPETGDFVWRRLQYVFTLSDPRSMQPRSVRLSAHEARMHVRHGEEPLRPADDVELDDLPAALLRRAAELDAHAERRDVEHIAGASHPATIAHPRAIRLSCVPS